MIDRIPWRRTGVPDRLGSIKYIGIYTPMYIKIGIFIEHGRSVSHMHPPCMIPR